MRIVTGDKSIIAEYIDGVNTLIKPYLMAKSANGRIEPVWLEVFDIKPTGVQLIQEALDESRPMPPSQSPERFKDLPIVGGTANNITTYNAVLVSAFRWSHLAQDDSVPGEEFTIFRCEVPGIGWMCGTHADSKAAAKKFIEDFS